jgi:hypothetical protein
VVAFLDAFVHVGEVGAESGDGVENGSTLASFYGDAGTKDGVSRSYKQAVEDLDAETIKALDGP